MAALLCNGKRALRSCGNVPPRWPAHIDCTSSPAHGHQGRALLPSSSLDRSRLCRATADMEASPATSSVLDLEPVYEGEYCSKFTDHQGLDTAHAFGTSLEHLFPVRGVFAVSFVLTEALTQPMHLKNNHNMPQSRELTESFFICSAWRDQY